MTEYMKLLARAKKMGHKLTPELRADLRKVAGISDDEIKDARKSATVKILASDFQVPIAAMERRLGEDL